MKQNAGKSLRPRWPWSVVRAKQNNDPVNPIRYEHTFKLAVSILALAVLVAVVVFPARAVEQEMQVDAESAKLAGFPQLPPGNAWGEQIDKFIDKWNLTAPGSPSREDIEVMAERVGKYGDDTSLLNLGLVIPLIAIAFVSAVAFPRALNNVFALGFKSSAIPPAWAAISWFVPLLSFVLPWRVVAENHNPVEVDADGETVGERSLGLSIVSTIWGLAFLGLWLLNPMTVPMLFPTNDIDGWLTNIAWQQRMMFWLPITSFITAFVLLAISFRQHKRYRRLETEAASGG